MSRCFPFPPPEYEKKNIVSDIDLLTKEKRKEKKHKKDTSRDRKEGKDKKDKERSKEKRREKKEYKEKHKDKKDRKEKHRDREKVHESSKSKNKTEAQLNCVNGARLDSNVLQTQNHDFRDPNNVQELATRIRVETGASGDQIIQKQGKDNGTVGSNHLQVLVERILEKEKNGSEGQILQKIRLADQGKVRMSTRTDDRNGCLFPEQPNGKEKDKQVHDRVVNGSRNFEVAQNFKNVAGAYGGSVKSLNGKDVRYNKESDCTIDKHKSKGGHMERGLRNGNRDQEEKAKEINELSNREPMSNLNYTGNIKTPKILAASGKFEGSERNLGKRKEFETNGFLHENGGRPNKLKRPVTSSQTATQNGMKLELSQKNGCKADSDVPGKENGLINAQLHKITSWTSPPTAIEVGETDEASIRPAHPDSIRLSEILSLAEIDKVKVTDFDGQEWLLCNISNDKPSKMDETNSPEEHAVWAGSIRIESADISALPYVVPY